MNKVISLIIPSRNTLKYLKWAYTSIRKNLGYLHEICMADDFSNDGTWEWMKEISEKDKNVKIHRNDGPTRLGHTILYDTLVDMASNDIVMIFHSDMYACPNLDTEMLKHLERGKVVSATRIEPPLHPDGPEKILKDFGIEPEEFKAEIMSPPPATEINFLSLVRLGFIFLSTSSDRLAAKRNNSVIVVNSPTCL